MTGRNTKDGLFWCPPHQNEDGTKGNWFHPDEFGNDRMRVGGKTTDCKVCRVRQRRINRAIKAEYRRLNPPPPPPRVPIELPMTLVNMMITRAWNSNLFAGVSE